MLENLLPGSSGPNSLIRGRRGYFLYNRHDIVVGRSMACYGEYFETEVAVFAECCRPGDIVCDIGANIGTHTVAMAQLVGPTGRVIAMEAQQQIHHLLCANVALNGLGNVEAVHAAAGSAAGTVRMPAVDYDAPNNFGGIGTVERGAGYDVACRSLDDIIDVPHLRLIKIDVEGMEAEVVRGAARIIARHRPILYVENDRLEKSRELLGVIGSMGYRMFWHLPMFFNPGNYAGNPENIHAIGFYDAGDRYGTIGFAINMVCIPAETDIAMALPEAIDLDYHPLRKTPNGPVLPEAGAAGSLQSA